MAEKKEQTSFEKLYAINVNDKTEDKNGLTYLSWAWAWAKFKQAHPNAEYEVKKFENGLPYAYDPNTGYMVYTSVTVDGLTHEMWLPVMDGNNKAMKSAPYTAKTKYKEFTVQAATMFDINKTIMRCLTKNLAMFGLGLYIYAGEDLPEDADEGAAIEQKPKKTAPNTDDDKRAEIKRLIQETNTDTKKFLYSMGAKFKRELGAVDEMKGKELDFALKKMREKQKESEGK